MKNTLANENHLSKTLHYLFRHPQTSRVEIAAGTSLTRALVTHSISRLQEAGLVRETGEAVRKKKGSGKARRVLELNPDSVCTIGIEFNAAQITAARCRIDGTIDQIIEKPIDQIDLDHLNTEISGLMRSLSESSPLPVLGYGLAIPGHYDEVNDRIITNNPSWKSFSLQRIREKLNTELPLWIENNVECMSYGRYMFRSENSPEEFILLHVGPGLYCSFFDSALTSRKKSDYFGEIGHSVVDINGTLCECGKKGCLQTYISSSWLIKRAEIYLQNGSSEILSQLVSETGILNLEVLQEAYRQKDPYVREILEDGLNRLAVTISNLLIVHDADRIFINSQLLQEPELQEFFNEKIRKQFGFILGFESVPVEILPFRKNRGAQGACALVFYQELIDHPAFLTETE